MAKIVDRNENQKFPSRIGIRRHILGKVGNRDFFPVIDGHVRVKQVMITLFS